MAVIWLILKIIFWVLLGLLALVLVVLILPITAHLEYSAVGGFKAAVGALGLRFKIYPPREKKPKPPKPKKETQQQTAEPEPPAAKQEPLEPVPPQPERLNETPTIPQKTEPVPSAAEGALPQRPVPAPQKQPKPPKHKKEPSAAKRLLSILSTVKKLVVIAGGVIRRLLAGIWIYKIRIVLPVHEGDAAQTAIKAGQIHSAAGASLGVLQNFLHLSFKQYQIEPDYTGERQDEAFFSCKITSSLIIMVIVAVWALPKILKTVNNSDFKILPGR